MDGHELIELLNLAGFEASCYSGRGMLGRQCVSTTAPTSSLFNLGIRLAQAAVRKERCGDDAQMVLDDLGELSPRTDSMGHDTVLYFPDVDWPEGA